MEAEQSHHLPCGSWRPRKASGMIQFEFEGLRRTWANGVSLSLKVQKSGGGGGDSWFKTKSKSEIQRPRSNDVQGRKWKFELKQREQINPSSAFLFYSGP